MGGLMKPEMNRGPLTLPILSLVLMLLPAPARAAGLITGLAASANPVNVNTDVTFTVKGTGGGCGDLTIEYGDGQTIQLTSVSFNNNTNTTTPAHKYAPAKTYLVKATPGRSCTGTATVNLTVTGSAGGGGGATGGYAQLANRRSLRTLAQVFSPQIESVFPFSVIRPGGGVIVQGRNFGAQPGQFRLKLANGLGTDLSQLEWAGNSIGGIIDPGISGVLDQPATLQVINSSGVLSNEVPVQFTARREVKFLPGAVIHPDCSNGSDNNQCIRCTSGCTFRAYHGCSGFYLSCNDSGTDTYSATLANGWRYFSAQTRVEGSRADPPGLLRDEPGFLQVRIYWDTTGNQSAAYNGDVYVEGPVGTSW